MPSWARGRVSGWCERQREVSGSKLHTVSLHLPCPSIPPAMWILSRAVLAGHLIVTLIPYTLFHLSTGCALDLSPYNFGDEPSRPLSTH